MIEISVKGKWIKVPAFQYEDSMVVATGSLVKTARVHDEMWMETELHDPNQCINRLRESELHADIFTFTQKPPGREPEYEYYCEPDSIAVVRLTSFKDWWEGLSQETRKKRQASRETRCPCRSQSV